TSSSTRSHAFTRSRYKPDRPHTREDQPPGFDALKNPHVTPQHDPDTLTHPPAARPEHPNRSHDPRAHPTPGLLKYLG
ncbi:MAG: hypothetical protein ACLPVY_09835, partial [Acidimicrobiia bacterium]